MTVGIVKWPMSVIRIQGKNALRVHPFSIVRCCKMATPRCEFENSY